MSPALPAESQPSKIAALAVVAWSLVIILSLGSNAWQRQHMAMDAAYADARAMLNKDITFRRWATEHGGVYVPITEKQSPVPWMAHIPDRDIETPSGRKLTLLNPASMVRQMMDRYAADYGVRGRITGLKALNPANLADEWEASQLRLFQRGDVKEVWEIADLGGRPHLRYLRAMFMEPGCEKCHAILGYKAGELRGATGLSLPLDPYYERLHDDYLALGISHGAIWLLGLTGIVLVGRRSRRHWEESRAQEARVAKAELWYRSLFDQSPDGILIFNPATSRFVDFNRMAHEALGYTRDEFAELKITDFNPGESEFAIGERIQRVLANGLEVFETTHRKKSGDAVDVQVVIQKIQQEGQLYFLTTFRDISREKRQQAELDSYREHLEEVVARRTLALAEKNQALEEALAGLQTAQTHLVQAEKLASLGALVAGIAHELNTPIGNGRTVATTLVEQTEEFVRHLGEGAPLKRSDLAAFIATMKEGAELLERNLVRAADLIHSFKQVAVDRTSTVRRVFDLQTVVADVLSILHPRLKKLPFEVKVDVAEGIDLDSFPGPLGQVVTNLVENAIVHGLDGRDHGTIRVLGGPSEDGQVILRVEDDGHGIPPALHGRIFDPFFTTKLGHGGSGLGLNIVHNILTNVLGGTIRVESDGRSGCRFIVELPKIAPEGGGPLEEREF